MTQFAAYQNPNAATSKQFPYLLDIQTDLLDELRTTIVVPLRPSVAVASMTITKLNPVIEIEGETYTAMVQNLAGVDRNQLGKLVCNLAHYRSEIIAALDFVLSGI